MVEVGGIAARAVVVYFAVLVLVRLSGKRTVGNFTAFDLLAAILVGDVCGDAIYGQVGMASGLAAIASLMLLHIGNAFLSSRSSFFDRLSGGLPSVVIRKGRIDYAALRRELMHENELMSALRMARIKKVEDVDIAVLEPSGEISVQPIPPEQEVTRGDLPRRGAEQG